MCVSQFLGGAGVGRVGEARARPAGGGGTEALRPAARRMGKLLRCLYAMLKSFPAWRCGPAAVVFLCLLPRQSQSRVGQVTVLPHPSAVYLRPKHVA